VLKKLLILACALPLFGCGTMSNGKRWGQDVTLIPGWTRLKDAFVGAVVEPASWAPLAGALALQIGDADADIADWAHEETPVFHSISAADEASDFLKETAQWAAWTTAILAPGGSEPMPWLVDKGKGFGIEYLAAEANNGLTEYLKGVSVRTRPDESDDKSFPSGHASIAATYSTLGVRNVDAMTISDGAKTAAHAAFFAVDAGTAWGRVEAERHFPSDVLVGMAIGHFIAEFFSSAFLSLEKNDNPHLLVLTTGNDAMLGLSVTFE
jgi:hypothetical protein